VKIEDKIHDVQRIVLHDTLRETRYLHDSVYVRDSVYLEGAALIKERWRYRWRTRVDTVYKTRRDTVVHYRDVYKSTLENQVQHPPWYHRPLTLLGIIALVVIVLYVFSFIRRIYP
jgi:hypothetical protein